MKIANIETTYLGDFSELWSVVCYSTQLSQPYVAPCAFDLKGGDFKATYGCGLRQGA